MQIKSIKEKLQSLFKLTKGDKKVLKWMNIYSVIYFSLFFFIPVAFAGGSAGLILGVVGAVVGVFFGMPQIGFMIGAALGNALFPEQVENDGPKLGDAQTQNNTLGSTIPQNWGTTQHAGFVIEMPGGIRQVENVAKSGKGGGPEVTSKTYYGVVNLFICVGEGEIDGIRKIMANTIPIYDVSLENPGNIGDIKYNMRVYKGTSNQLPDPLAEQYHPGKACAYRGRAYVVLENLDLSKFGNQIPNFTFEVVRGSQTGNLDSHLLTPLEYDFTEQPGGTGGYIKDIAVSPFNNQLYCIRQMSSASHGLDTFIDIIDPETKTLIFSKSIPVSLNYNSGQGRQINFNALGEIVLCPAIYFKDPSTQIFRSLVVVNPDFLLVTSYSEPLATPLFADTQYPANSPRIDQVGQLNMQLARRNISSNPNSLGLWQFGGANSITPYEFLPFSITKYYGYTNDGIVAIDIDNEDFYFPTWDDETKKVARISTVSPKTKLVNEFWCELFSSSTDFLDITDLYYEKKSKKLYVAGFKNSVSIGTPMSLYKIDVATATIDSVTSWGNIEGDGYPSGNLNIDEDNRRFFSKVTFGSGTTKRYFTSVLWDSMEVTDLQYSTTDIGYDLDVNARRGVYVPSIGADIWIGQVDDVNKKWRYLLNFGYRMGYATFDLAECIKEICRPTGIDVDNEMDLSELVGINIRGYNLTNRSPARSYLQQLATVFNFDAVESNRKIKFIKRGSDVVVARIKSSEMGAKFGTSSASEPDLTSTRTQEIDLPKVANIMYYDYDKSYMQNTQESRRTVNTTENVLSIQIPIVLTSNEAKRVIDRMMYSAWSNRDSYQFATNNDYQFVEPTDVIEIDRDGAIYTIRITKKDESQGIIKWEGVSEQRTVYTQNGTGATGMVTSPGVKTVAGTSLKLLDIPIFDSSDDNLGVYAVINRGIGGSWSGASILSGSDSIGTFSVEDSITNESPIGGCLTKLGDYTHGNTTDWFNTVDVVIRSGELVNITDEELDKGENLALIGNEIIQFQFAELIGTKTYRLSKLLRGKFGTEQNNSLHNIGDSFVKFEFGVGAIKRLEKDNILVGFLKYFKAVSFGQYADKVVSQGFINSCVGQKPYAVNHVVSGRSSNDILINWHSRTRGMAPLQNSGEVTDLDGDSYEIDILKAGVVVRTIVVKGLLSATYTGSNQITDFGSVQSSVNAVIYKMNAHVGRGYPKTVIL